MKKDDDDDDDDNDEVACHTLSHFACFPAANIKVVLTKGSQYTGAGHHPVQLTCAYEKSKESLH